MTSRSSSSRGVLLAVRVAAPVDLARRVSAIRTTSRAGLDASTRGRTSSAVARMSRIDETADASRG